MSKVVRILIIAAVLITAGVRVWRRRRRDASVEAGATLAEHPASLLTGLKLPLPAAVQSDVALVAAREIRERTRGRVFRVGTIIILLAVAAAIVIPTLHNSSSSSTERVGLVGTVPAPLRDSIISLGSKLGTTVTVVAEPDLATARHDLGDGHVDVVLDGTSGILLNTTPNADDTSTTTQLAQAMALTIGLQTSLEASGLSAERAAALTHPKPLPISGLHPAHKTNTRQRTVTVYGLILLFVLLSQYGTWILLGVVEEKSSRVVEVLLATLRPRQLLAGKVLGIGIVALVQATLILAVALGLGAAVGSDLLKGGNPTNVLATVAWLVLGYVFYCWVYAAAGSLATRQEHIQTLAFPLQLPLLLGYITSLTAISSGHASTFVHVLAYLPPTSPFAMPVLVALNQVAWWQFVAAMVLSLAATAAIARLAATVYVRAILRTGQRVRLRDITKMDKVTVRVAGPA
jgi:ABC-2 type transport system permease protein